MSENTELATKSDITFSIASLNLAESAGNFVTVAKTGTTVTQYPFERLKFESNRQTRFAILTEDVCIVKRHYHPELGYILSDGLNDKYFDTPPMVTYIYPVAVYTDCSDRGKPMSDKVQVKMLQCNKDMYNFLIGIQEIKGSITQFDFLGSQIPGSDKFKKTQLIEAGPALWRNNSANRSYIANYMEQNKDRFLSAVGKIYTPEKLEELLGISSSISPDTSDFDEVFKTP